LRSFSINPHTPYGLGYRGADGGAALVDGLHVGAPVDGEADRQPRLHVVEGRLGVVDEQVVDDGLADGLDLDLRHGRLHLVGDRLGPLTGEGDVEATGLERRVLRPALHDDHVADAVEIRPALDEVIGILHQLDVLTPLPLLELERPGPDTARAHLGGGDVGGIHRRVPGREHEEQRRLRPLEMEDDGVRIRRLDVVDVGVPVLARVEAQLALGVLGLADHVERVLDVLRAERLAVVPLDALAEEEHEVAIVVLPRPLLGQLTDDRVQALDPLHRVVHDEIVEARRGREHARDGGRLVDREALRQVLALHGVEDAAGFRCLADRRSPGDDHDENGGQTDCGNNDARR
jgi:hypothetical protein